MDVSAPPSLDSACPQAKTELSNHDHRFSEVSIKKNTNMKHQYLLSYTKVFKTTTSSYKASREQVMIQSHTKVRQSENLLNHGKQCSWSENN